MFTTSEDTKIIPTTLNNIRDTILYLYFTLWMKKGDANLNRRDGSISTSRTTDLGTFGPTISIAAERMTTYRMLLVSPNTQNEMYRLVLGPGEKKPLMDNGIGIIR